MPPNSGYDFRALFTEQVYLAEADMDLQRSALYLAGEAYPDLDVAHYLRRMDEMAGDIKAMAGDSAEGETLARDLNRYLFDLKGFSGNTGDYYNPQNSFLNRVIDTGIGIPITLSVLYLGLAARLGMDCHGIGMPGHFLVKIEDLDLYMDPFHGGQLLSAGDCRRLAEQMFGSRMEWDEHFLFPTPPKSILARMLNNLRVIYAQVRDIPRLAGVLERMLLFDPPNVALHRDLALCYVEQGDNAAAVRSLENLISNATSERDAEAARNFIEKILRDG